MRLFAIRHGETAWSLSGQHTGTTDIPLTDNGRRLAERLRPGTGQGNLRARAGKPAAARAGNLSAGRSWRCCRHRARSDGMELRRIRRADYQADSRKRPGWLIFRDGCPGGEAPEQVGARVDRVIDRARAARRRCRALRSWPCAARLRLRDGSARRRAGDSIFCSIPGPYASSGYYRDVPAVKVWNGALAD